MAVERRRRGQEPVSATADQRLGERIRSLRLAKGYTLKQLSTLTGLSASFVSMLENGKTGVAAARLQRVAEAFGLSAADLLPAAGSGALIQTVRVDRRPLVRGLGEGVAAEMLVRDLDRRLQPVIISLAVGARHLNATGHAGEEFVLVLKGSIELLVDGDQSVVLAVGDSAYYPSALSHAYENVGTDEALMASQSPQAVAHQVRTPTLVLHSANDLRCPLGPAERYYATLKGHGVETELVVFPGENHELSRSGRPKHRLQRHEIILDWLGKYLPPIARPSGHARRASSRFTRTSDDMPNGLRAAAAVESGRRPATGSAYGSCADLVFWCPTLPGGAL